MIYFSANIRSAHVRSDDSVTSGSVGIPVALTLDAAFDGLAKTLCFKTSTVSVDIALVGDATESTIPPDVLTNAGEWLHIGIYAADGNGNIVIPTVWANVGKIEQGTIPSGVDPSEPTPSWAAQVQNMASEALQNSEDAVETANDAKEKAEKAEASANDAEAWAVGERDGEPVSADDPTYENNAKYWAEQAMTDAPVTSVNGKVGDVALDLDDIPNGKTYARATPAQLAQIATNTAEIADVKETADTALQPDDLRPYRTAAAQDAIDQGQNTMIGIAIQSKQAKITASGILKGDGAGGVSSATAGTDYATPQQVSDKYTKPSDGIPSTDMTAAVQASLQLADTALQAVPDTYRTAADQDVIDDAQDERLDAVEKTTTATTIGPTAIATFEASAANMPLKGLTVDIEPVQTGEGDPSPENVRPITGWTGCKVTRTGKNLVFKTLSANIQPNGVIKNDVDYRLAVAAVKAGTEYTINILSAYRICAFFYQEPVIGSTSYNGARVVDQLKTFTAPIDGYIAFRLDASDPEPQLELGSVATDYEPYQGNTYPITFPGEAGTVYGGTLTINADGSGELRKHPYYASYNGESLVGPWVSSMDVYAPGTTPTIGAQVVDLGGVETVYQLTAQQVTTLLGTNNIWADCGDVTVTYGAYLETVKAYADQVGDSVLSAIAPLETSYTASRAYAAGSFLFVGTKFYKVTVAIAGGDTINPGTNATQTTVAEQLIVLAANA